MFAIDGHFPRVPRSSSGTGIGEFALESQTTP